MVKTNRQKKLCQNIGGVTICVFPSALEKNQQAVRKDNILFLSQRSDEIFKNFSLLSPYPAFLFRKEKDHITLLDYSMAALILVSEYHSENEKVGIGHIISFFERLSEMPSAIVECFFSEISFSKEVCTQLETNDSLDRYRCFKCTICPVDIVHVVVYMEPLSSLLLEAMRLHQEKERMDLTMDMIQCGTWEWSITSGTVATNTTWAAILSYQPIEIKNDIRTWEKLIHPEDRNRVIFSLLQHLRGASPLYYSEHRLINKHGESVWVRDCGKIITRTPNGTPLLVSGELIDISKQKEMELCIQELQKQVKRKNEVILCQNKQINILKTNSYIGGG